MSKKPHVLIVDDDPDFRALIRVYLARTLPAAALTEYDPESLGMPANNFSWADYDVLLLDYQLGEAAAGLSWLANLSRMPNFPPTILVTGEGDEYVAVRALKLGAEDYLRKQDLNAARLAEMVSEAALAGRGNASPATAESAAAVAPDHHEQTIVRGLNGYRMLRKIGAGTQSRIYLAKRLSDGLEVALKIIAVNALSDAMVLERFQREAAALNAIRSPHVVRFYEQAFAADCGYLVMEYLPGGGLRRRLNAPIDVALALRFMTQLLGGLEVIHHAGVVHRDLKPTNILLRDEDSLVIADFGISRRLDSNTEHTTEGMLIGTPAYMSPEQCLGQPVDARADLYSAGIVFFEMLTGRRPFSGESMGAILHQHVHSDIPRLPSRLRDSQALLDGLLAKRPSERISSAQGALALVPQSQPKFLG